MAADLAKPSDWVMVDLPRELWSKSRRPGRGLLFRITLSLTFVLVGLALPGWPSTIGLGVFGVLVFFALPLVVDRRLEAVGEELSRTPRSQATAALTNLEKRRLVALFAPHAWVALQKGRLHLILDDGRAAAHAFAEAARMVGDVEDPRLMGAQAQGFILSGDRKDARALLTKLESAKKLSARDQLNLAIVYVEEPSKIERAIELLEEAQDELGPHPRVDGALALAYARADQLDDADERVEAAEADDEALRADPLAQELVKRARKELRQREGKKGKKEKTGAGASASKGGRSKKKDRRKERRAKRKKREGKAEPRDKAKKRPESEKDTDRVEIVSQTERKAEPEPKPKAEPEAKAEPKPAPPPEPKAEPEPEPEAEAKPAVSPKPKPVPPEPVVVGSDDKPVFRPPPIPPPPKVGSSPKVSAPKIPSIKPAAKPASAPGLGKPPVVGRPPVVDDEGWGDLLGDDEEKKK